MHMNIQNLSCQNMHYKHIPFTSTGKEIRNEKGEVTNRCRTVFFREDLNWDAFTDKLIKKYKDKDKINIYCYASSDGSEPYSLAMLLISKLGEKEAQKFFPIHAMDKVDSFLQQAEDGEILVREDDIQRFKDNIGKDYLKYIDLPQRATVRLIDEYGGETLQYEGKIKPIIKDAVVFEKADITESINNVKDDNSVVMFRNAWAYLSKPEQYQLVKNLQDKLNENSMLIIGSHDLLRTDIETLLEDNGFEEKDFNLCYEKSKLSFCGTHPLNNPNYLFNTYIGKK